MSLFLFTISVMPIPALAIAGIGYAVIVLTAPKKRWAGTRALLAPRKMSDQLWQK